MNPALATAYAHGPGKEVAVDAPATGRPGPPGRVPLGRLAGLGDFGAALAAVLTEALTPCRWEPWNSYNDHRAYPSPRAAYLVDAILAVGSARWPVDPVRRALVGTAAPENLDGVRIEVALHPDRVPAGYGALADALAELEAGHLTEALVEAAERHHLQAAATEDGLSLRPDRAGRPPDRRPEPVPDRSSGLGPCGLSADPRPLPIEVARPVLDAVGAAVARHPFLAARLAVHNVRGLPDGWYDTDPLRLVRASAATEEAQAGFGYGRESVDVAGMNVVCVLSADLTAALSADPASYRAILRAAGASAQRTATAAAVAGLFCRPARSMDEATMEAAARLPAAHDAIYLLLLGRSRVTDFRYDLTAPTSPTTSRA